MAKQVIVVVHGVGVKQAGVSSDLLSTALQCKPDEDITKLKPEQMSSEHLRPHSTDDFELCEFQKYSRNNLRQTFPARIRRYRQYGSKGQGALPNERVIADFYWGDIAAIGQGLIGLLAALLKIILGLCHAIRENAHDVFPEPKGYDRAMRAIASGAALVIHGPIAAINAVLLVGVFVAWGMYAWIGDAGTQVWAGPVISLIAIAAGWLGWRASYAYLMQLFAGWVVITGLVLLGFSCMSLLDQFLSISGPFAGFDSWLKDASCRFAPPAEREGCIAGYQGIYLHGLKLLVLMSICWLLVFLLALVTGAVVALRSAELHKRGVVSLLTPTIGLMTLLWFLTISCAWAAIVNFKPDIVPHPEHVTSALWGLVPALATLVALLVAAGWVWWRKRELGRILPKEYLRDPDALAERHRLIVSRGMMVVLVAFIFITALLGLLAVHSLVIGDVGPWARLLKAIGAAMPLAMTAAGLMAVAVVGWFRTPFATALGILADVLTYLNDYSWNSREVGSTGPDRGRGARGATTPAGAASNKGRADATQTVTRPHGYWLRERIKDRLKVLVNQLIRDERPDVLAIVAHSQGTVVALDAIDEEGAHWLAAMPEGGRLRLVTMGSPYTHLHHHYFPSSFPSHRDRPALRKRDEDRERSDANPGVLSGWVNIFRVDDFVGTHIGASQPVDGEDGARRSWPEEHPVPPNGHTLYWVDEHVAPILREVLRFRPDVPVG